MSDTNPQQDEELRPTPSPSAEPPPTEAAEPQQEHEEQRPEDRRWARLTARFSTVSRERDELAQRVAQLEQSRQQAASGQQPPSPELQQYIQQEAQKLAAAQVRQDREQAFHTAAYAAYPDWEERRHNLVAMGADAELAELLVETPNGARLAGELHDNPDELERIAAIRTRTGRAVALGQFAAKLEQRPARTVSRAPRPPQPVTGRASPAFDEYGKHDPQVLVEYYRQQDMERRK